MAKTIEFNKNSKKEEQMQEILGKLQELKHEFADLVDLYEEEGESAKTVDALTEALDAMEDACELIQDVIGE